MRKTLKQCRIFLFFGSSIAEYVHTYGVDVKQNNTDNPHLRLNDLENKWCMLSVEGISLKYDLFHLFK